MVLWKVFMHYRRKSMRDQFIIRILASLAIFAGLVAVIVAVAQPSFAANGGNGSLNGPGDPQPGC